MYERLRLLYVALTRAEKWLIVAAAGELDKGGDSWYQMVQAAMARAGAVPQVFEGGSGLRYEVGDWTGPEEIAAEHAVHHSVPLPGFLKHPVPERAEALPTLGPSDLGGAKALPGEAGLDEEAAKERGTRIHLLLEHLPGLDVADWQRAAENLLTEVTEDERAGLLAEARGVLTAPDLVEIFAADALAEVPVTAPLGVRRMHGVIDRLIVTPERILAVDFKTNATVPTRVEDCPEGLMRQMGAYAAALAQIYPDRPIETALLWTRTAQLMTLPHDLVTAALGRAGCLDDVSGAA